MKCHTVMDKVYESIGGEPLPLLSRLEMALHFVLCPHCAQKLKKLEEVQYIIRTDFLPLSPDFEESIMDRVSGEEPETEVCDAPTGVSFRGWVITGFIILISLSTSFFGMNFVKVADAQGSSFLLPVGLTIGMVLTGYGALFIGSHLKELSTRFRLH